MKQIKILLLIIGLLAFVGCPNNQPAKKNIKVGAIVFQTGDAAQYGVWVKNGLEMAKDEINSSGGINGQQIEIVYEDDKTDAQTAVTVMNKLLSTESLSVIIAGLTSKSTLAVAPIAESKKVVLFSPCSSSPDITNSGDYIFRNWASDNEEGRLMADYAYNNLGYRNIVTLTMNNDYGLGLQKVFSQRFKELGGNIVSTEEFAESTTNFRTVISKLQSQKFDAIYMPSHAKEAGAFLKQMKENNQNFKVLGSVTYESPELIQIAGDAANGVIFTTPAFNPDANDDAVKKFSAEYQKRFGSKPENFAAHSYDSLKIIALAIEKGGNTSEGIKNALYQISNYSGVSGLTTFDTNGDVKKPAMIKQVKDGQFVSIEFTK